MNAKLKHQRDELNGIIHRENLYVVREPANRRVIDCRIVDKALVVRDLYTGADIPVAGSLLMNGYGKMVTI